MQIYLRKFSKRTIDYTKQSTITGIRFYTRFISPILHQALGMKTGCRYEVTCSQYAQLAIAKNGLVKGSMQSLKRIASCQPYFK